MSVKEQIKELWRICFDEDEAFIDMYFNLRYADDANLFIQQDDKVISALQLIPYPMTFCGTNIPTSYISGACTHPDYRRKGVMHELLSQAFARMYSDGVFISTLIPEKPPLVDYYARMDYTPVFRYSKQTLQLAEIPETGKNIRVGQTTEVSKDVYHYVRRKMSEHPCCIQHTEADFKVIQADLSLSKGYVFFAVGKEEKIEGVAFAVAREGALYINELLSDSAETASELLKQAAITCKCNRIEIAGLPAEAPGRFLLGMARIIHAKEVLTLFAATHPEVEMNIELHDTALCANNGYYCLKNGKCTVSKDKWTGIPLRWSAGELTEKILGEMHPYMSLMIN
ncbi:hypothetical protein EZS27_001216 [termite gut metagenome]|uniref:N-acetyltransferase domain-containing protein n=1 Tax=termite gut metagenome TaxID=433724 RepID=A0A5J4SZF7_9ZZZZ